MPTAHRPNPASLHSKPTTPRCKKDRSAKKKVSTRRLVEQISGAGAQLGCSTDGELYTQQKRRVTRALGVYVCVQGTSLLYNLTATEEQPSPYLRRLLHRSTHSSNTVRGVTAASLPPSMTRSL